MVARTAKDDEWVYSICNMCYGHCGIKAHRVNGVVVRIEGNPDYPHNSGRLCAKGNAGLLSLYDPHRTVTPVRRTNPEKGIGVDPKWEEISWEEALNTVAETLKKVRDDDPRKLLLATFDLSVRALAMIWAQAFGSPNTELTSAGMFCGAGLHMFTYMTNATFHSEIDLDYCNYAILFGNQLGFGVGMSPNLLTQKMADARVRGMKLVVVDPVGSTAASKANEWLPIRPGTDAALALAMVNVLVNELGIYDSEFIRNQTNGPYLVGPDGRYMRDETSGKPLIWDALDQQARPYDDPKTRDMAIEGSYEVKGKVCQPAFQKLRDHVRSYSPEKAAQITTVPVETIRRIASEFGQAAHVGSTVVIEGRKLPYRPVAVNQYRGATSHKHGGLIALSIQLLNLIVGAIYVPGGHQGTNPVGPWWSTGEGPDGLLVAGRAVQSGPNPYHFLSMKPEQPQSTELWEFFPATWSHCSAIILSLLDPAKYGIPKPEIMLHSCLNLMMTSVAPEIIAQALKNIPFIVSFAKEIDETVEFADIVFPELHYLERLDPVPTSHRIGLCPASKQWYWGIRQPVVEPGSGGRHTLDVLTDLAERVGFLDDFYKLVGSGVAFKEPYKLEKGKRYAREELADIWLKAIAGPERGLAWFQEHGCYKYARTVEESYPLPTIKQRIPIYYEHLLQAGEFVQKVRRTARVPWDVHDYDYQPLPDWKPCPAFEPTGSGHDLFVVNYTIPFHQYSITAQNPWLNEISERHPYVYKIMVNNETARQRGIHEGDTICVETVAGRKVTGKAKVTECVHPEVVAIGGVFGAWAKGKPIARGKGAHFNSLLPLDMEHVDMLSLSADACERVKVYRPRPAS